MIGTEFVKGSGFGNQLLQYLSARCIALDRGCEFGCVNAQQIGNVLHSQKGLYFMQLDTGKDISPEEAAKMTRLYDADDRLYLGNGPHDLEHGCYVSGVSKAILEAEDNTLLMGNLQAEEYFLPHLSEIREWMKIPEELDSRAYSAEDLCIINMRGGEYTGHPELFLDRSYWLKAMKEMRRIRKDMRFMIITEDVEAARKVLPEVEAHHFDLAGDFSAIKNAHYLILSNSSFAVVPAMLSTTLKYAIAPKYWARHNVSNGYWASEQNIYSFLNYMDRGGRVFTPQQCREELENYKKSSGTYAKLGQKPEGAAYRWQQLRCKCIRTVWFGKRIARSLARRLGLIRTAQG